MKIYSTQNFNIQQNSFGLIKPEHLFINSKHYNRNLNWAKYAIENISHGKNEIRQNFSFEQLLHGVAQRYNDYFSNIEKPDMDYFGFTNYNELFGKPRSRRNLTCVTRKNPYAPYVEKFQEFLKRNGSTQLFKLDIYEEKHRVVSHQPTLEKSLFRDLKLTKVFSVKDALTKFEQEKCGDLLLGILPPKTNKIPLVLKKIQPIYKNIIDNNASLTPENTAKITRDIARIHWYLSQIHPFVRGSAGIADIICKTLFEHKGIQVSKYKKNVDPNLEAFINNLEDYASKYKTFFEEPLKPIKNLTKTNVSDI